MFVRARGMLAAGDAGKDAAMKKDCGEQEGRGRRGRGWRNRRRRMVMTILTGRARDAC